MEQWSARRAHNPKVAVGSNPATATLFSKWCNGSTPTWGGDFGNNSAEYRRRCIMFHTNNSAFIEMLYNWVEVQFLLC